MIVGTPSDQSRSDPASLVGLAQPARGRGPARSAVRDWVRQCRTFATADLSGRRDSAEDAAADGVWVRWWTSHVGHWNTRPDGSSRGAERIIAMDSGGAA
jgi:hypothetical protein